MVDLMRKTESKIYSLFDTHKLAMFPNDFYNSKQYSFPLVLLSDMGVGFRLVNQETEQIVQRLRIKDSEDVT